MDGAGIEVGEESRTIILRNKRVIIVYLMKGMISSPTERLVGMVRENLVVRN